MKIEKVSFQFGEKRAYTDLGCSPVFLNELCSWLQDHAQEIKSVDIALYLFNNLELYNTLEAINGEGCKVTVYSIPLEGYDRNKFDVINHRTNRKSSVSKYDLAQYIYKKFHIVGNDTFSLRIVPHISLRSKKVKPFSRGTAPYSLHCKTACIQFKDGRTFSFLTSSNLAVRDAEKHEVSILSMLNDEEAFAARDFFDGLYQHSILISDYLNGQDFVDHTAMVRFTPAKSCLMYTAPFYENSAFIFEKNICNILEKATQRIIVCAQHISAYQYQYNNYFATPNSEYSDTTSRPGFLDVVLRKCKEGVPVTFLSQTYSDALGSHGCRAPENRAAFINFVEEAKKYKCRYFQSNHLHCKFIVADDTVIITTCNFTPSQFIYLPNVYINAFDNIPNYSYRGTHCEYGVYQGIIHPSLAADYVEYTNQIIRHKDTRRMF